MDYKLSFLILKNTAKLEKLILHNAPYSKILKQSQLLDKYINEQMIRINKIKR